jgi:hypothetical protein
MVWIFTGESKLTPGEQEFVEAQLLDLRDRDVFKEGDTLVFGGAPGVDSVCALWFTQRLPWLDTVIYVPDAPYNERATQTARLRGAKVLLVPAPPNATMSERYMERNTAMVRHPAEPFGQRTLVAFPRTEHELKRSGPWATIRRGRAVDADIVIYALEGATE